MKSKFSLLFLLSVFLFSAKSQVPTKGLVLYLPLNGNANDSSTYASNGLNHGATPVTDRFGIPKKAMSFDGNDYINISGYSSLDLTKDKTISCWVFLPSTLSMNNYPTLIHKDEPVTSCTYSICLTNDAGYYNNQYKFDFYFASNYSHYQALTKQLYTNYKDKWLNIVGVYDYTSGYSKIYLNGVLSDSIYFGSKTSNSSTSDLYLGCGKTANPNTYFKGYMDDVRIYNRPISKNEVMSLFLEEKNCVASMKNDTTTYYVSTSEFNKISPRYQYIKTDSLKTKTCGYDSIINRYAKYEFKESICYTSVMDTLTIKLIINGTSSPTIQSIVKIYPNPAKDHLVISYSDYSKMSGYSQKISNTLGQTVYQTSIFQPVYNIDLKSWTGKGTYFVQIYDSNGILVENKKLILQ